MAVLGGESTCTMCDWAEMEYWGKIVHSSSPPAPIIPWAWQRVPWTSASSYASIVTLKLDFSECPLIDNSTSLAAKSANVLRFLDWENFGHTEQRTEGAMREFIWAEGPFKLLILRSMRYWMGRDKGLGCWTSLIIPWKSTQSRPATPIG